MPMTEDARDIEIKAMKKDIEEIKTSVEAMPDKVSKKITEIMDLKIQLVISETEKKISDAEKKYQAKFIAMLLGIIGEAVGLIISFFYK